MGEDEGDAMGQLRPATAEEIANAERDITNTRLAFADADRNLVRAKMDLHRAKERWDALWQGIPKDCA